MRASIEHIHIYQEKYSRPQRSAVAHGINWRLVFICQGYLQQTLSIACSDFKRYYDRIVRSAASLALQRLGIPLSSIISMLDTIRRMAHRVRTESGDSNLKYGGETITKEFKNFMMGICQVNRCAPQLWSIISSIVFSLLRTQGLGIHFVNYFTMEIAKLVGLSYIDDCDMIQSDNDIESTHSQIKLAIS